MFYHDVTVEANDVEQSSRGGQNTSDTADNLVGMAGLGQRLAGTMGTECNVVLNRDRMSKCAIISVLKSFVYLQAAFLSSRERTFQSPFWASSSCLAMVFCSAVERVFQRDSKFWTVTLVEALRRPKARPS